MPLVAAIACPTQALADEIAINGCGRTSDATATNAWESGNKIILTNASQDGKTGTLEANAFCRFDEGSKDAGGNPIGTY